MPLLRTYAKFVKIAHTVFALPFAITGMLCACLVALPDMGEYRPELNWFGVLIILLCMVGARSFAMAINRIVDRHIDSINPRTANREIPAGDLSVRSAWVFALAMAGLYFAACAAAGTVVLALSPIPVLIMVIYPFMKRWHWSCHYVLGLALGLAPVGAWVAIRTLDGSLLGIDTGIARGEFEVLTEPLPWILGGAVALWVAGFDIIYALQDDEFDRENGLHSVPADFGRQTGLLISRITHALSALLFLAYSFIASGKISSIWPAYTLAAPIVVILGMLLQHRLVRHDDLSRVNMAFFTVNGVLAILYGAIHIAAYVIIQIQ